jgi:hypothetical protein
VDNLGSNRNYKNISDQSIRSNEDDIERLNALCKLEEKKNRKNKLENSNIRINFKIPDIRKIMTENFTNEESDEFKNDLKKIKSTKQIKILDMKNFMQDGNKMSERSPKKENKKIKNILNQIDEEEEVILNESSIISDKKLDNKMNHKQLNTEKPERKRKVNIFANYSDEKSNNFDIYSTQTNQTYHSNLSSTSDKEILNKIHFKRENSETPKINPNNKNFDVYFSKASNDFCHRSSSLQCNTKTYQIDYYANQINNISKLPTFTPNNLQIYDRYSCQKCEESYRNSIVNKVSLKINKCLYCSNIINTSSLDFYLNKYKKEIIRMDKNSTISKEDGHLYSRADNSTINSFEMKTKVTNDTDKYTEVNDRDETKADSNCTFNNRKDEKSFEKNKKNLDPKNFKTNNISIFNNTLKSIKSTSLISKFNDKYIESQSKQSKNKELKKRKDILNVFSKVIFLLNII